MLGAATELIQQARSEEVRALLQDTIPRPARFRTSDYVQDMTLTIEDGLVEVETKVECHGANTKSSEPDADKPRSEEEVQRT